MSRYVEGGDLVEAPDRRISCRLECQRREGTNTFPHVRGRTGNSNTPPQIERDQIAIDAIDDERRELEVNKEVILDVQVVVEIEEIGQVEVAW